MSWPARYPKAVWKGDGRSGGSYTSADGVLEKWRVVIHTTETAGMPAYRDGNTAPHLTFDPRTLEWTQHTSLLTASRSLRNESGGVQTNRERSIQIEIICYSDKRIADQSDTRDWVGDLTYAALLELRSFLLWTAAEFGVEMTWPGRQARSYAEASASGFRLTGSQWDDFGGVLGHQHVPENSHWDPGALDWNTLFESMEEEMIGNGLAAAYGQLWLIELGYDLGTYKPWPADGDVEFLPGADGKPGTKTAASISEFQEKMGITITGTFTATTMAMLKPSGGIDAVARARVNTHVADVQSDTPHS